MKDLSPRLIARLAALLVSTPLVLAFVACDPGRPATPPPQVESAPATVEPDDADRIPCGPRRVLQAVCQQCHQDPPTGGAPFPLVTRSNIVRVSPDGEIRELMIQQLEAGRMPLSPVTIDYDSRLTLLDWLQAGAPAEERQSCDEPALPDAAVQTKDAGDPSPPPVSDAGDEAGHEAGHGTGDDAGDDAGTHDDATSPDASASD
jgi:hypothetical protein